MIHNLIFLNLKPVEEVILVNTQTLSTCFSETVIVVDDVEKVSTLPMNEQQIVERFFEIGNFGELKLIVVTNSFLFKERPPFVLN